MKTFFKIKHFFILYIVLFITSIFIPVSTSAAISLISGGAVSGSSINGGDVTLTFPVGVQENDVVILFGGHSLAGGKGGPSTAGYTRIASTTASQTPGFGAWYKVMGASPDTSVVGQGTGTGTDSTAYAVFILHGVDPSIFDATSVTAGPTASTNPNAASITTVTDDAWVLDLAGSTVNDTSPGTVSGYTNTTSKNANDSNDITVAGATKDKTPAGAEDPADWSTWSTGTWFAITIALKPKPVAIPTVTTGVAGDVSPTDATLFGDITSDGGDNITQYGFATSTDPGLLTNVSTTTLGSGSAGLYSGQVLLSSSDTTYYYRAYATNSGGTGYGSIQSFNSGNTTVTRVMRLFEGFVIKFFTGKIILFQK